MKLAAGVKPDYIGENKPRTNLIFLSLDVTEMLDHASIVELR